MPFFGGKEQSKEAVEKEKRPEAIKIAITEVLKKLKDKEDPIFKSPEKSGGEIPEEIRTQRNVFFSSVFSNIEDVDSGLNQLAAGVFSANRHGRYGLYYALVQLVASRIQLDPKADKGLRKRLTELKVKGSPVNFEIADFDKKGKLCKCCPEINLALEECAKDNLPLDNCRKIFYPREIIAGYSDLQVIAKKDGLDAERQRERDEKAARWLGYYYGTFSGTSTYLRKVTAQVGISNPVELFSSIKTESVKRLPVYQQTERAIGNLSRASLEVPVAAVQPAVLKTSKVEPAPATRITERTGEAVTPERSGEVIEQDPDVVVMDPNLRANIQEDNKYMAEYAALVEAKLKTATGHHQRKRILRAAIYQLLERHRERYKRRSELGIDEHFGEKTIMEVNDNAIFKTDGRLIRPLSREFCPKVKERVYGEHGRIVSDTVIETIQQSNTYTAISFILGQNEELALDFIRNNVRGLSSCTTINRYVYCLFGDESVDAKLKEISSLPEYSNPELKKLIVVVFSLFGGNSKILRLLEWTRQQEERFDSSGRKIYTQTPNFVRYKAQIDALQRDLSEYIDDIPLAINSFVEGLGIAGITNWGQFAQLANSGQIGELPTAEFIGRVINTVDSDDLYILLRRLYDKFR